jgi:hypothetical protein
MTKPIKGMDNKMEDKNSAVDKTVGYNVELRERIK